MSIHLVPGVIVRHCYPIALPGVRAQMVDYVFRAQVGRIEIIIAIGKKDP
jgi:hypothetical protein